MRQFAAPWSRPWATGRGARIAHLAAKCCQMLPNAAKMLVNFVGHGGSFTAEVRRVLFNISISRYQSSFDLYHHSLGTPVRGQFLMYIRALRATLNRTDRSLNSVSLLIS